MLRVWRVLPPRYNFGAPSSTSTDAPPRRALIAAHSAALPPPITSTSYLPLMPSARCDEVGDILPRRRPGQSGLPLRTFVYKDIQKSSKRHRCMGRMREPT